MEVNKFDVLKVMSARNLDIRGFPLNNIKSVNTGKKWGSITLAINNETVRDLMMNKHLVGMLVIADGEQFDAILAELSQQL